MKSRYLTIRKHSESICSPLEREDYVVQPSVDVSPPKWHLAHTTWFWEEFMLAPFLPGYKRFHSRYSFLFNSYYESMGERVLRLDRGNMSRPTVNDIINYRAYVDEHMQQLILTLPDEAKDLFEIGLNHEEQHQELLYTDIKYILGHNPLFPVYKENFKETTLFETSSDFTEISDGMFSIGHNKNGFSFDNEHAHHQVYLSSFAIRKSLVTNGEYVEFINDGGYKKSHFWYSDAWTWINENKIDSPMYWYKVDEYWHRYALSGFEKLNMNEPVTHISMYEAAAFAEWNGMRLPTEFEWEAASNSITWGQRWEHTNSAYLPYPGYKKPAGAVGEYNGKFMINQMVLRGASIATPQGHARNTYRNFFQPQLRWQFNGIRLCKK